MSKKYSKKIEEYSKKVTSHDSAIDALYELYGYKISRKNISYIIEGFFRSNGILREMKFGKDFNVRGLGTFIYKSRNKMIHRKRFVVGQKITVLRKLARKLTELRDYKIKIDKHER